MPEIATKRFGYDDHKSAPSQLRKILRTESDETVEEILSTLRCLTSEELDFDTYAHLQERQIALIKRKLKEKYPDTFGKAVKESERRLFFAYKYMLYAHAARRKQKKKNNMNLKESTKTKELSASLNSQSLERAPPCNGNTLNLSKAAKIDQENTPPSPPGSVTEQTLSTSEPSRISTAFSQASPSKVPTFAEENLSLPSETIAFSRRSTALLPSTHGLNEPAVPSYHYVATIRPIHEFLDTCVPSMTHHLHSFLEFGCDTPEHLFSMSMWQPGMIHEVLDKLPPNVHGEQLTEMEKLIIQNHLLMYFKS